MAAAAAKHVVLFPFPGQGHLSAFMSLADLLHATLPDAVITLVSTPRNVAALRATAPSFLGFHALPFTPADHGLPPDCESSDAVQPGAIADLLVALESLEPVFDDYLSAAAAAAGGGSAHGAVCVVSDPFTAWTVTAARRRGCAHALFASCGAYGSAVVHSLWSHLPVRPDPATGRVHLPEYPDVVIHRSQLSKNAASPLPAAAERIAGFYGRQIPLGYATGAVIVNTVEEFEPTGLAMLRRTLKVPVWPIGPLVRTTSLPVSRDAEASVMSFLDCHPPASVLYISFGSQNSIRAEHMTELALALESTGRPFVWAVRPPDGHDIKGEFRADQWLPAGFEGRARAGNRGLLVRGWAPQVRILAHASTGAFLSHCGWNSVLESVTRGVPIVGWPLAGEQFYNAKMLEEEWGACVEVARGNMEDTVVDRGVVAGVVETVMGRTAKAAEMRRRAAEIREVVEGSWKEGGGSSRKAMEDFLRAMNLR